MAAISKVANKSICHNHIKKRIGAEIEKNMLRKHSKEDEIR
jgi:hypothetical protein